MQKQQFADEESTVTAEKLHTSVDVRTSADDVRTFIDGGCTFIVDGCSLLQVDRNFVSLSF